MLIAVAVASGHECSIGKTWDDGLRSTAFGEASDFGGDVVGPWPCCTAIAWRARATNYVEYAPMR